MSSSASVSDPYRTRSLSGLICLVEYTYLSIPFVSWPQAILPSLGSEALSRGLSVSARRQLTWWLGGTAAWVYSMVVLGGVTRLTRSGLSMTEWKFTGGWIMFPHGLMFPHGVMFRHGVVGMSFGSEKVVKKLISGQDYPN